MNPYISAPKNLLYFSLFPPEILGKCSPFFENADKFDHWRIVCRSQMKKTTYPKDKWLSCIQNSLLLQPITRGTGVCRPIKQAGLLTYRSSHLAAFPVSQ